MRVLFIMVFVISAFVAMSLLFFRGTRKTYPGFDLWTTGVSPLSLGYFFLCLRGYIPDAISILVSNTAFPTAMVLHLAGMRRFLELPRMSRLWYLAPVGSLAAAAVFYYGYDSIRWRILFLSVATSLPHFAIAFLILLRPVRPKSTFYVVIGSLLASGGAAILGRGIWSFSIPHFQLLASSPVELIFFGLVVVLQLGENLSFIMLNSERVENELLEAEADLKRTVQDLQQALAEIKKLSGFLPICLPARR